MEVTLVTAFLGGALALLSPCGALLLPAFFATTTGSRGRLALHTAAFFVGLSLVLLPLGLGAGLLGSLVTTHRDVLVGVGGWVIIGFGLVTMLGLGLDLQRVVPGARAASAAASRRTGLLRALLMGGVAGVAGFCAGPILGAVLTMAAVSPPVVAGATLVVYGAGMVVPLAAIALAWERLGTGGRAALRGRGVTIGPVSTHTTSLVSGALLAAVGVLFLSTNGLAALPDLVPTAALAQGQRAVLALGEVVPDVAVVVALAVGALGVWALVRHRRPRTEGGS